MKWMREHNINLASLFTRSDFHIKASGSLPKKFVNLSGINCSTVAGYHFCSLGPGPATAPEPHLIIGVIIQQE